MGLKCVEFEIGSYATLKNTSQRIVDILENAAEKTGAQSNLDYLCHWWGAISWEKKSGG